jgi:hypothetical protein
MARSVQDPVPGGRPPRSSLGPGKARANGELRVYSQSKPEFFRIYRFEQGADVVRGAGTGPERLQKFTFKATGEKLSPLFDGTEQLINMTSVPWYQREIYLPGS